MKLPANAYAIGPGFHDWEREQWEEQEIRQDIKDAAYELLDKHIRAVIRKERKREQEAA